MIKFLNDLIHTLWSVPDAQGRHSHRRTHLLFLIFILVVIIVDFLVGKWQSALLMFILGMWVSLSVMGDLMQDRLYRWWRGSTDFSQRLIKFCDEIYPTMKDHQKEEINRLMKERTRELDKEGTSLLESKN